MNGRMQAKSVFWLVVAVGCGCTAVGLGIAACSVVVLGYAYYLFALAAVVSGSIAIRLLVKTRRILRPSGVAQILLLLVSALLLNTFLFRQIDNYRVRKANEGQALEFLRHIRVGIEKYVALNKHMPPGDSWCKELATAGALDMPDLIRCGFVLNQKVGNVPVDELPGNVVLIFETGRQPSGFSEGPELLNKHVDRDRYYLFPWERFIYVLFVDGTIVRYRRWDGAIAKYEGPHYEFGYSAYRKACESFGPFTDKGTTPYSPLRWE